MGSTNLCSDGSPRPTPEELKKITQGCLVCVDLDLPPGEAEGREQKKCRPAVVVSADRFNSKMDTMVVVPVTALGDKKVRPHEVLLKAGEGGLTEDSIAQAVQIRTVDRNQRVTKICGQITAGNLRRIQYAIGVIIGAAPIP